MLSTELALLVPIVLFGFVSLIMLGGRWVQAETDVMSAAQEAARAATFKSSFAAASAQARQTAQSNLTTAGQSCTAGPLVVSTTTSAGAADLQPGTIVTVTVSCTADLADVSHLGSAIPLSKAFTATAHEVVDTYRSSP